MIELIEKLLDEAELDIVWDQDNPDYKWVEGTEESLLKFAELIVRECIEVCKSRVGNSDYTTGRMHCVSDIKEHFGVEE